MVMPDLYLNTGQTRCYDTEGNEVPCHGSGQDGDDTSGIPWPEPRFEVATATVLDRLTQLYWTTRANFSEFPVEWNEAFELISQMNDEGFAGHSDWRMPNRRELRSIISYQTRNPALPTPCPFEDTFIGWYWTSTTAAINPAYAWYVHLEGGRMFYGKKSEFHLVWPVRGGADGILAATGQRDCFNSLGQRIPCRGSGQDGDLRTGVAWPEPRYQAANDTVLDRLTGLVWTRYADLTGRWTTWEDAFELLAELRLSRFAGHTSWCLPTINELESLVDSSQHTPALSPDHPFEAVQEAYWSSTSSAFQPDWCMALYMHKGAVGVGQKKDANFSVWAVARDM